MKPKPWTPLLAIASLAWAALPAQSQSPAGQETLLNERLEGIQFPYAAACDRTGSCAAVWYDFLGEFDPDQNEWIYGRRMGPHGELDPLREIRFLDGGANVELRRLEEGFLLAWTGRTPIGECPTQVNCPSKFQDLGPDLAPRGEIVEWQDRPAEFSGFVTAVPTGLRRVILWWSHEPVPPVPVCDGCEIDVNLTLLDPAGSPVVAKQPVDQAPGEVREFPGSVVADTDSRVLVAFTRYSHDGQESDVYLRRFSPLLEPLGPPLRINEFLPGIQSIPQIAVAPSGQFVVVWMSQDQDGDRDGVFARRFGADGEPLGQEFQVNTVTLSAQRSPKVAMDDHGNFVVVWHGFTPGELPPIIPFWDVKARLFRADGTPVSREIYLNLYRHNPQEFAKVAFAPNGTFFASWSSGNQAGENSQEDVYARRFSASAGAELCWLSGAVLSCDLAHTGGAPEMSLWAGWMQGAVPLAGDFDGDGRDDLCTWRDSEFRCDLDHEGRPVEGSAVWGLASDTPLLGDVDGDARVDPCVRRKRRLLCDTARDGGFAELQMPLGTPTGTPLLGDIDGDGRDDVCLFEAGLWTCRTWAGGGFQAHFGSPAGEPALADLDDNGRADLCVLESHHLRCDTARDGGAAEFELEVDVPPGARLLLGNLDGL